jgi:acyl carrier protein
MTHKEKITEIVFASFDIVNDSLPAEKHLKKSLDTVVFGEVSVLDSLGVVNFITALEDKIQNSFGVEILLIDDEKFDEPLAVFNTAHSLVDHIDDLLSKKCNQR